MIENGCKSFLTKVISYQFRHFVPTLIFLFKTMALFWVLPMVPIVILPMVTLVASDTIGLLMVPIVPLGEPMVPLVTPSTILVYHWYFWETPNTRYVGNSVPSLYIFERKSFRTYSVMVPIVPLGEPMVPLVKPSTILVYHWYLWETPNTRYVGNSVPSLYIFERKSFRTYSVMVPIVPLGEPMVPLVKPSTILVYHWYLWETPNTRYVGNSVPSLYIFERKSFRTYSVVLYSVRSLCIMSICNFSYSHFGFEGGIWVLIAPVSGHCLLVTFSHSYQGHFVPGYEVTLVRIYLFCFIKARDQRSWV